MAQIDINSSADKNLGRKKRAKKLSTHIDMTPMVDLMSLLITFFMLTTAFSKPKIMEIILPQKDSVPGEPFEYPKDRTLNLLVSGDNKIYYYFGKPPLNENEILLSDGKLFTTNYGPNGLRKLLLNRNMILFEKLDSVKNDYVSGKSDISQDSLLQLIKANKRKDKNGPLVLIKTDKSAKYRNIVDVIDEMEICNVARYAIVDPNEYELKLIANTNF
jgi:biopolymer transport protein ExbD